MELIVAVDNKLGIGKDNALLCHLPGDLKHFKEITRGRTVLMGYNTLMSLPKNQPLKDRVNAVLTRKTVEIEGARVFNEVSEALAALDFEDTVVIGGESVYRQLLPFCTKAHITKIDADLGADRFFPELGDGWEMTDRSERMEENGIGYCFEEYRRTDLKPVFSALVRALYPASDGGALRIASYNTLHLLDENSAAYRYPPLVRLKMLAGVIEGLSPDSIGLQEMTVDAREELLRLLPDYGIVPGGRPGRTAYKNYTPILYKKDRLELADSRYLSFGETGCYSVTKAVYIKNGRTFVHFNTHLSVYEESERIDQAKTIARLVNEERKVRPGAEITVTGDFNSGFDSPVFEPLTEAGLREVNDPSRDTWHHPGVPGRPQGFAIDHVLTDREGAACFVADDPGTSLASDHSPVVCDIRL